MNIQRKKLRHHFRMQSEHKQTLVLVSVKTLSLIITLYMVHLCIMYSEISDRGQLKTDILSLG